MTDDQTRRLDNALGALLESVATLKLRVEKINETVAAHEEILHVARECAQRQQLSLESIGACVGDIDQKLRVLDSNDQTLRAEILQTRAAMALLAGAMSVVSPRRGDVN